MTGQPYVSNKIGLLIRVCNSTIPFLQGQDWHETVAKRKLGFALLLSQTYCMLGGSSHLVSG